MTIAALNCSCNQLWPAGEGPQGSESMYACAELAGKLGVKKIVCMSGLPPANETDTTPNWITSHADQPYFLKEAVQYQWKVTVEWWKKFAAHCEAKPTAVILTGVQGDETHDARLEGYTEGFEEAGGEVLEVQYCDALADKAAAAMESLIGKYPDGVNCVLSTNDDMVMAAVKVIGDSTNENYKSTLLCGFDGNQSAIEAIEEGTLAMDVAQLGFDMGYKAVETAVKVLDGETVDSFVDSGAKVVTTENVAEYVEDMKAKGLWEE